MPERQTGVYTGPVRFSYSEVEIARACPKKWELAYYQRWRGPSRGARALGSAWHRLLETHYNGIKDSHGSKGSERARTTLVRESVLDCLQVVCYGNDSGQQVDTTQADEQYELLLWMYEGHLDRFGLDEDWQILEVEYKQAVPVFDSGWVYSFVADLVVLDRKTGQKLAVDHKSSSRLPKLKDFDLNDQFPLYTWALNQLGFNIAGAIRSEALTRKNKSKPQDLQDRFARFRLHSTERQQLGALGDAIRSMESVHSWVESGDFPRHLSMEYCSYRCDFREACLIGRAGGNEQAVLLGSKMTKRERTERSE